jgi:hypothetical protein
MRFSQKKREAPATNPSHRDFEFIVLLVTFMIYDPYALSQEVNRLRAPKVMPHPYPS